MGFRPIALLVIFIFSIAIIPFPAFSQDTFGPACGRAIIDGRVDPSEWSAASSRTFQMIGSQNSFQATLSVMNSKNYLYLGITIDDDEFSTYGQTLCCGDEFRIDFNNDNSGPLFALNDEVLFTNAGLPKFIDGYIEIEGESSSWPDEHGGGATNGIGFSNRQGNLNHFELRHPLCSGESLDFCLSPGNTVGFRMQYLDAQANGTFGGSYYYPEFDHGSLAQIEIAPCTVEEFFLYLPLVNK